MEARQRDMIARAFGVFWFREWRTMVVVDFLAHFRPLHASSSGLFGLSHSNVRRANEIYDMWYGVREDQVRVGMCISFHRGRVWSDGGLALGFGMAWHGWNGLAWAGGIRFGGCVWMGKKIPRIDEQ